MFIESEKKTLLVWQTLTNQPGDLYLQLNQGNWQLDSIRLALKIIFIGRVRTPSLMVG